MSLAQEGSYVNMFFFYVGYSAYMMINQWIWGYTIGNFNEKNSRSSKWKLCSAAPTNTFSLGYTDIQWTIKYSLVIIFLTKTKQQVIQRNSPQPADITPSKAMGWCNFIPAGNGKIHHNPPSSAPAPSWWSWCGPGSRRCGKPCNTWAAGLSRSRGWARNGCLWK